MKILQKLYKDKNEASIVLNEIIKNASKYPLKRSVVVVNKSTRTKLQRIQSTNVELFNRVLESSRYVSNHKVVRQILKTDRMYPSLCEVANDAEEFCRLFELEYESGFAIYCSLGLKKIGKNYNLNKFKTYKEHIFQKYERQIVVENNEHKQITEKLTRYYIKKCEITNQNQITNIWETYAHDFVYATEEIVAMGADYDNWIDAQFKGLEYLEIIPEPYQLHGEGSKERYLTKGKITKSDWRIEAKKKMI